MRRSILWLAGLLLLCGCGGGSSTKTPPAIAVSLTPSAQTNIDQGQTLNFTASVSNDSASKGVTWAMSGTNCTGSACGTFTNSTATGVTYNAPAAVTGNMTVTVQATSAADTTKAKAAAIVVSPEPSITTTTLSSGAVGTAYNVNLQAGGGAGTMTWSLDSGSSLPAGLSLSSAGVISGTPTAAGTKSFTVKVTDSSAAHEGTCSQTKQLSITIAPPPISISLAPATQTNIDQGQSVNFTATVNNDSANKGVTWAVSGATCTGSACGALANTTSLAATYNAPTTVSANMTVMVQATSVADTSKSTSTAVVVSPPPNITTATLADGVVGTAYSATVTASGGAGALTWSVASGSSLPAGLSLSGAGTISGTPATAGTTNFTVKVTDASQGQPGPVSQSKPLSITIAAPPLSIVTTSLPNATENVAYSEPLQASGGTPPYTWTVASGSALPAWLSLKSGTNWTIAGTPTEAGTSTFSLTVSDSSTPTAQSKTQALSITVVALSAACGTGNESIMQGQYAFSLRGWNSSGFLAAIGSFTADGNGHITAGTVDSNGTLGVKSGSITASGSSYSVGSDNRGCATIVTPFYTFTTRFALEVPKAPPATAGALEEWEPGPTPYIAVGRILLQKNIPAKLPAGNWVFQQSGIYSTSQYRTGVVGVIKADGNGNYTGGEYDSNMRGTLHTYTGLTGTYTNADPTTGRYTQATTLKGVTDHRAIYLVSSTHFLELTTEAPGLTSPVLIGEAHAQSGSLTVSGKLIYSASGVMDTLGNGNTVQIGLLTVTGATGFTMNLYEDYAGTWTTPTPTALTCRYAIDTYGKLATTPGSGCLNYGVSIYLTGPNTGVTMASDTGVLLGQLAPQSATSLTSGAYYFGTQLEPVNRAEETEVGVGIITGGGVTGVGDITSPSSPQQASQPISETLTVNSDGTFSTANHPGVITGVVVSNSQIVLVSNEANAYPTLVVINTAP